MSDTRRRVHFNKKRRFFTHYWEYFNEVQVRDAFEKYDWMKLHQYHGDNYYTKRSKEVKQSWKNQSYREMRREFRDVRNKLMLDLDMWDGMVVSDKPRNIKWCIH